MRKRLPVSIVAALSLLVVGVSGVRAGGGPGVAVRLEPGGLATSGVEASASPARGGASPAGRPTS